MNADTWARLNALFAEAPVLRAGAADPSLIDAAAAEIGVVFPPEYREFLVRHGGAIVGPFSIYGIKRAPAMERSGTVVQVTKRFRAQEWPGTESWVVFSMDHGGNPVGFDAAGVVWISDHDFGGIQRLADGFEAYIRQKCLGLPG